MLINKSLMDQIKGLGLNSYEVKIWTALLSRGVSTAGELSDIANVPRSRSYDVLESLEKKGFVVMKIGKPIKYIAMPPKEVLERVKKNIKQESQTQIDSIDKLRDSEVLHELDSIHKQGITFFDPVEMSGSLKDKDSVYAQMATMIKSAEKEIILVSTDEHIEEKLLYLKKYLEDANKRGVDIKIAAPENTISVKEIEKIASIKKINIRARFCIVDRESILFLLTKGTKHQDPGIWVNTPIFSETIVKLFELSWQTTQPLKN